MLTWMLYVVCITLLLSGAALAAERAARLRRARSRWIWVLTILASLAIPTIIASVSIQVPSLLTPTVSRKITALREMTSVHVAPLTWVRERTVDSAVAPNLNRILQRSWVVVSAVLFAALVLNGAQVFWRKRRWRIGTVAGASVYIAPDIGPAVVGLLRPRIVVPTWLTESPPSHQAMVIAHEQAHLAGHDPQVLTVALFLLVLMPWNLPLWWQLHRLRYAIEVDCDARVLERGLDTRQYGEMLIDVSQRPSVYVGAVAAMSESRSFLEERITIMVRDPVRWGAAATVMFGCLALALVAVAAQITPPNVSHSAGSESQAVSVAPEVLERYVGFYVRGGHMVLVITREGSKLLAQLENLPTVALNADSETDFRISVDTRDQYTFVLDEQGQATGAIEHMDRPKFSYTWPRVDTVTAQQILANNKVKFQSQTPTPGSEPALRRLIDAVRMGKCDEHEVAPWFAKLCEETQADVHWGQIYASWGAVQSIEFIRVDYSGGDVYSVRQEHGRSEWMIYLNASGVIEDADNQRIGE
jgi:bla regulator protein blaR1